MIETTSSTAPLPPMYRLATDTALRPAVVLGQGQPDHVSGLPAFYYWKDAIVAGRYTHPAGRFTLDITRERLSGFARTFGRMKSNGVGVPILMDHAQSAASTLGWIVDVKVDGERFMELHQFLGETARDIGLRNKVSLGIDPDFVDGKGTRYGEAIVHSAVTPLPVVPGQGEFEAVEARLGGGGRSIVHLSLCPAELTHGPPTTSIEPTPDSSNLMDVTPVISNRLKQIDEPHARSLESAPDGDDTSPAEATETTSRSSIEASESIALEPMLMAAAPSLEPSPTADGAAERVMVLSILCDAVASRRDAAVMAGNLTPAVANELFGLLARSSSGELRTMCLSRHTTDSSTTPLALAVFDVLSRNRPVPIGQSTGVQVLSRVVPGSNDAAELQRKMIELASGT